jgi:hypothetical protein
MLPEMMPVELAIEDDIVSSLVFPWRDELNGPRYALEKNGVV